MATSWRGLVDSKEQLLSIPKSISVLLTAVFVLSNPHHQTLKESSNVPAHDQCRDAAKGTTENYWIYKLSNSGGIAKGGSGKSG